MIRGSMDPVHEKGSMDPVHILMDPVHGPGPRRGSMDQGSMFCTFPFLLHLFCTTDEGNYNLWKIRHNERQTSSFFSKTIL